MEIIRRQVESQMQEDFKSCCEEFNRIMIHMMNPELMEALTKVRYHKIDETSSKLLDDLVDYDKLLSKHKDDFDVMKDMKVANKSKPADSFGGTD